MSAPFATIVFFVVLWLIGGFLLILPFSTYNGISPVDAFFTSASAVSLTGLTVKNTAEDFTLFGKVVIITLIQISGLGIVSFYLFISYILSGKVIDITYRRVFSFLFGVQKMSMRNLVFFILIFTLSVELIGAGFLYITGYFPSFFIALFHSISAFCHAGFDLTGKSLIEAPISVIAIHASIIFVSSLGAPTLFELMSKALDKIPIKAKNEMEDEKRLHRLSTHSRIVLWTSLYLILFQTFISTQFIGWKNIHHSLFLSISARTAGFSSLDLSTFPKALLLLFCVFMFIGASPGSSGGGIRTVTFATILIFSVRQLMGYNYTSLFKRRLPDKRVKTAVAYSVMCFSVVFLSFFLLLISEENHVDPIHLLFETVSAFATVGLSAGITPNLQDTSKIILIITMLLGKIGIINIFYAMYYRERKTELKYAEEDVILP